MTSSPTPAALLPCPFCGGEAEIENVAADHADRRFSVGCFDPDCIGYQSLTSFARKADASTAWNRRNDWQELSCDEQFSLATRIAANVGYDLVPEQSIQDAEDAAEPALYIPTNRLERLRAVGDQHGVPLTLREPSNAALWTPLYTHADRASRPSPPPSGDVEALIASLRRDAQHSGHDSNWWVEHCRRVHKAADLLASQAQTITQERELRKAAEEGHTAARQNSLTFQAAANTLRIELVREREKSQAAERHLRTILATDDAFRSSISPKADKDLLTIACDAARIFLNANDRGTNDGR